MHRVATGLNDTVLEILHAGIENMKKINNSVSNER